MIFPRSQIFWLPSPGMAGGVVATWSVCCFCCLAHQPNVFSFRITKTGKGIIALKGKKHIVHFNSLLEFLWTLPSADLRLLLLSSIELMCLDHMSPGLCLEDPCLSEKSERLKMRSATIPSKICFCSSLWLDSCSRPILDNTWQHC